MAEHCRPVINSTKTTDLLIGLLVGAGLFFVLAKVMGWLTF